MLQNTCVQHLQAYSLALSTERRASITCEPVQSGAPVCCCAPPKLGRVQRDEVRNADHRGPRHGVGEIMVCRHLQRQYIVKLSHMQVFNSHVFSS